jgi:hypothetical protein
VWVDEAAILNNKLFVFGFGLVKGWALLHQQQIVAAQKEKARI